MTLLRGLTWSCRGVGPAGTSRDIHEASHCGSHQNLSKLTNVQSWQPCPKHSGLRSWPRSASGKWINDYVSDIENYTWDPDDGLQLND